MGQHKSQHYVPKVYLRNFSDSPHQKTVGLFNIASGRLIEGAPIKSQCASNYLYGYDELEHELGDMEGRYSEWVSRGVLKTPPTPPIDIDLFIRFFMSIQYMRTAGQVARIKASMALMDELANLPPDHPQRGELDLSDTSVARENVFRALEMQKAIGDLAFAFIKNESGMPFITCDDPVVLTNRLYIQRLKQTNFGLGNAGAIIYLPLSPYIAVILYDSKVYALAKNGRTWSIIKKDADASAFNGMVYLKARDNLYFHDPTVFSHEAYAHLDSERITEWHKGKILQQIGEDETGRFYAEVDEPPETESYIIGVSQQHPRVLDWPSNIRFRQLAGAFSNGSNTEFVRSVIIPPGSRDYRWVRV